MFIIVVDDDSFDRSLITKNLMAVSDSVDVLALDDPRAAYGTYRDRHPDLTLLDVNMPELDGFEVLRTIRQDPDAPRGRVYMLSSSTNISDRERSEELGADGYFVKPDSMSGYRELAKTLISELS